MTRKHRIKEAKFGKLVKGFVVLTKDASSFYSGTGHGRRRLLLQAPHLVKLLRARNPRTDDEINELLKGRYIYGKVVEKKDSDGHIFKVVI